jgi:UTP:GlnB (protein PII) uridylyltransferase
MRRGKRRVQVHFLPVRRPDQKRTQRDAELKIAEAKAHAAKVAHSKKRGLRYSSRSISEHSPQTHNKDAGKAISSTRTPASPVLCTAVEYWSTGKLDPFVILAADLSRLERDLIHFCKGYHSDRTRLTVRRYYDCGL